MRDSADLFSAAYEESRQKFIDSLLLIRQVFPAAEHRSHPLSADPGLTIDWISAQPVDPGKAFILTTGLHGIEGYTGAAVQQLCIREFLPRFDPRSTGLLLVHVINPWGMKHRRKVNASNVDLNRNFNLHPQEYDPEMNPAARRLKKLVYPRQPIRASRISRVGFVLRMLWHVLLLGRRDFMAGALMGQYCFPDGIFYGGMELQEESRIMLDLFHTALAEYPQVLHLDMHTGYGPRKQMSLVNSTREPASSDELSGRFHLPLVQKADASQFYAMHGDMTDHLYRISAQYANLKRFYSANFEFGTYGDSLAASIRSLRTMVFEMQAQRFGARDERSRHWIEREFDALYDVRQAQWVEKALADARRAFDGIFKAEGFYQ